MNVTGLTIERADVKATVSKVGCGIVGMHVDLEGIDVLDFIACADSELINGIIADADEPDVVADLILALQQIDLAPLSHGDDAIAEMQRIARAAIAKATGQEVNT